MNIKTANRLCELRKAHNLSQEDLANKLGVSRQAISKWERSESSPDTDNLIQLASIYNISLDELINGEEAIDIINENMASQDNKQIENENTDFTYSDEDERWTVTIKEDTIVIEDEDGTREYNRKEVEKKRRSEKYAKSVVTGVATILTVVAYLTLGFLLPDGWYHFWFLFILIPVYESFVEVFYERRLSSISYTLIIAATYCALGCFLNLWHPLWILFITIPVYSIIAKAIDNHTSGKDCEMINDAYRNKKQKDVKK